jgi:WD40 repeat protein
MHLQSSQVSLSAASVLRELSEVCSLKGHTLNVTDAVVSPDGQLLATSSADQTIRVWDATPLPE